MLIASLLAVAGGGLIVTFVGDGPFRSRSARFDPSAVTRVFPIDRRVSRRSDIWDTCGRCTRSGPGWPHLPAQRRPRMPAALPVFASIVAFVTIASGAIGSVAAGSFADRIGKARIAGWAMVVSGACCAIAGAIFTAPAIVILLFAVVWGVAAVADSAQLSALVAQYSPRDHVGTALTVQTCVGFLLTMASIRLLPVVAQAIGWQWTFLVLVPGPLLGALAVRG